ncbi:hypothetical protein [Salinigranum sp. GCM10025319]|uniref:hypothetical protein n=1 Tax=Salinigranum sp. GCM10025319 TaxID=3252687 RepID=UPI00361E8991
MTPAEFDTVVSELNVGVSEFVTALGSVGTLVLLTGIGLLVGLWYIPWFQTAVLSGVDGPSGMGDHDDVSSGLAEEGLGSVDVDTTSIEERVPRTDTAEIAFVELADIFAVVTDPDSSHPDRPREPAHLTLSDSTGVLSEATDPVVTPVDAPADVTFDDRTTVVSRTSEPTVMPIRVPTDLSFEDLTSVVARASESVVEPVQPSIADSVDDPWEIGTDDTTDSTDLAGFSAVAAEGSDVSAGIDDQWEAGSDAGSHVSGGRDRSSRSASEAGTDPVHAGGEGTSAETAADPDPGSTALVGAVSPLPRRKLLGAIATIGSAAALGGSGTSAFFGDNERFANNTLVAGDLDLKVDWTEHYSDWSDDEAEGIDVSMDPGDGLVGFPSTAPEDEQSVFVDEDDVQAFLANTAIEAFPDQIAADDPTEATYDALQEQLDDDLCDLPADAERALSHPYRTRGTFPADEQGNAQTTAEGDPLVNITDLKPGDFGEVTFSFHLCGNPGYVWLTGALREAAENGVTEPEGQSPNEAADVVELLDAIQVALWYDTGPNGVFEPDAADKEPGEGDNFFGSGEQIIPLQGSLRNVLSMLESGMFPLDAEPLSEAVGGGGGGDDGTAPTVTSVDDDPTPALYNSTEDEPFASDSPSPNAPPKNFDCADYQRLLDDVGPLVGATAKEADELLEAGMSFSACGGSVIVHDLDIEGGSITVSTTVPIRIFSVKGGREGENIYVWPESVYLDEVTLTTPTNQAISNVDICCTVDGGGGGGQGDPNRQCFENSTTAYVGFEWWIPMDVGNEIQTDSISFDLGFYTEQCRHNDGSGMGNNGGTGGGGPDDR